MTDSDRSAHTSRIAIITGASRGLGRTLAGFLALEGYDLVIDARGAEDLATTAEELRSHGGRVAALRGDVTDPGHRARLVAAAADLGGLDLLVNNASTLGASPLPALAEVPLETLRHTLEVNLVAPLALVQAALPLLEARRGLVVNVSSDAATGGYPSWGVYGSSKAALDLVTLTFSQELAERGVSALSVDPGDMCTTMHQLAFPGQDISDRPLPTVTLPFWAWLLGRSAQEVSGRRFAAQADVWTERNDAAPVVVE